MADLVDIEPINSSESTPLLASKMEELLDCIKSQGKIAKIRALLGEFIGTFLLIFIGVGAGPANDGQIPIVAVVFAGLVISLASAFEHISGAHFNPCVTLAMVVVGNLEIPQAIFYVIVQLVAATAASALLHAIYPSQTLDKYNQLATTLNTTAGITPGLGIMLEAVMTFTLISTILLVGIHRRSTRKELLTPIPVGFVVLAIILMDAGLTGASVNPARSFGPALVGNFWDAHYVYWVGPLLGAFLAALCCKYIVGL